MEAEVATDIARALLTAYGTSDPGLASEWAVALADLETPRAWAVQQPHGQPEAVILTARDICRVTVTRPGAVRDGACELVVDCFRIDDSIRLFSGGGKWTISFPRAQVGVVLKEEPLPAGQPPGRLRSFLRAVWRGLPEASRGSLPPP